VCLDTCMGSSRNSWWVGLRHLKEWNWHPRSAP